MTRWITASLASALAFGAQAASLTVDMHEVSAEGVGQSVGQVQIEQNSHGLVLRPDLKGLSPGTHGFHLHTNGSCEPAEKDGTMTAAAAAGGHWDPDNAGRHGEPWGDGHLGDLPVLIVDSQGQAHHPVLAPRIDALDRVKGLALMVHEGGDNHSDKPEPLGGGGARVVCGVIK